MDTVTVLLLGLVVVGVVLGLGHLYHEKAAHKSVTISINSITGR